MLTQRRAAIMRKFHADAIAAGGPIADTSIPLSGGGPDGAFGAGVPGGCSARDGPPDFARYP